MPFCISTFHHFYNGNNSFVSFGSFLFILFANVHTNVRLLLCCPSNLLFTNFHYFLWLHSCTEFWRDFVVHVQSNFHILSAEVKWICFVFVSWSCLVFCLWNCHHSVCVWCILRFFSRIFFLLCLTVTIHLDLFQMVVFMLITNSSLADIQLKSDLSLRKAHECMKISERNFKLKINEWQSLEASR